MDQAATTATLPEPLASYIARQLARAIEEGEYKPGERLAEEAIAQRFGVSRAPVREALQLLVNDELAVQRPRRGTTVIHLSVSEMNEMYEVRSALYAAVMRLFVRRATPEVLDQYEALRKQVMALARDPSVTPKAFVQATQAVSGFAVAHCGNARLQAIFRKMTRQAYRFYAEKAHSTQQHRQALAALGSEMAAAVRAGDAEKAAMLAWRIGEGNHAAALAALSQDDRLP